MYSILGLKKFLWYCGLFAALVAVVHLSLTIKGATFRSDELGFLQHLWNSAATGISTCLAIIAAGDTKLFAFLCRKTSLGRIFPPIEGVWTGSLESNIKVIAERDPALAEHVTTDTVQAEMLVNARLLSVTVALRSRKLTSARWYQTSDTITADIQRVGSDERLRLAYVFRSEIPAPLSTDTPMHMGAAVLVLTELNGIQVFDGEYCTNRNWQLGRNTAGRASFTMTNPASTWPKETTLASSSP